MFYTFVLLFFIYSFIGWLLEVFMTLINDKKFVNRGFLLGPCCPIYGFGCLLITILLSKYQNDTWPLFALTILICSTLEYITSWIMEKLFKMRWWDYSHLRFNINGRICLETMLPFSIIGVLVVKYVNPFFSNIINNTPNKMLIILSIISISIFIVDIMISCNVVFNLKNVTKNLKKDSTEEIKKAVHKLIHNNQYMYERVVNAFPNMTKVIKEKTKQTKEFINKHTKSKKKKIK